MTLMRFCYGALTVMVLMLCRYAWSDDASRTAWPCSAWPSRISGAGFFAAAVLTPWAVGRLGQFGWMVACAATAAVLEPALGLPFAPAPMLVAAFVLGLDHPGREDRHGHRGADVGGRRLPRPGLLPLRRAVQRRLRGRCGESPR